MSETIMQELCQARSTLIRELATIARPDRSAPEYTAGIEKAINETIKLHDACHRLYEHMWKALFANNIYDGDEAGKDLQGLVGEDLRSLETMQSCADLLPTSARDSILEAITRGVREARAMLEELSQQWPWEDDLELEEGLAACERGDWIDAEDLFNELQNQDRQGS